MSDGGGASAPRLGEFGRIDRFFKPLAEGLPGALQLQDDAAVVGVPEGCELVVTTDAMVAGVHFLPGDPPEDIAAKLLRVNLSDLAAMGADPFAYTLATALPAAVDDDWLAAFAAGLAQDQRNYGIVLAGGDSVSTSGPITLSVTAMGLVPRGQAITRRAGRDDARLFVTGTIGDAALGLMAVLGQRGIADGPDRSYLVDRLRRPEPRVALGRDLRGVALAAVDVSDGLLADLSHLCRRSACAAEVEAAQIPFSPAAARQVAADEQLLPRLLSGGDDYELLFAVGPEVDAAALSALAHRHGVAVTAVGRLRPGVPGEVVVRDQDGTAVTSDRAGWVHF